MNMLQEYTLKDTVYTFDLAREIILRLSSLQIWIDFRVFLRKGCKHFLRILEHKFHRHKIQGPKAWQWIQCHVDGPNRAGDELSWRQRIHVCSRSYTGFNSVPKKNDAKSWNIVYVKTSLTIVIIKNSKNKIDNIFAQFNSTNCSGNTFHCISIDFLNLDCRILEF